MSRTKQTRENKNRRQFLPREPPSEGEQHRNSPSPYKRQGIALDIPQIQNFRPLFLCTLINPACWCQEYITNTPHESKHVRQKRSCLATPRHQGQLCLTDVLGFGIARLVGLKEFLDGAYDMNPVYSFPKPNPGIKTPGTPHES